MDRRDIAIWLGIVASSISIATFVVERWQDKQDGRLPGQSQVRSAASTRQIPSNLREVELQAREDARSMGWSVYA